ncbi:glycosyltransferase family 39 protein [Klenkia sp. PcliD-1-E]|uniref:glycosyltransferase family 39 protein n=1 Tax=Klenkia sp. PcliD-1-E TaxID=2954492 RepID=UPI00209765B6|nr:glycosyltransferase family 39 protein [Klenkia sp. PcliD-1-E]MCO7218383.1 glycosyltransferase family 39 protein [Klenkia sp. PcliD-1-E]
MTTARVRLILGVQLVLAGVLYTVGVGRSGWANAYYAAAAQAGATSWHAFLFGALDPAGGITVDKPPAALWLMAGSVRLFGLTPQALLWPQAACGVAAVGLLYLTVRRHSSPAVGLMASGILAVTPVVTLMARYDNPDTLMTLLLVGAAYAVTRAVDRHSGGTGWVVLAGALVGLAFLTKQVQGLLVLPALAAVLLVAGPGGFGRRLLRALAGAAATVLAAGWWVLVVLLTPAQQRPYIGGTATNSIWELTLGYNGLGRLNGAGANGTHAANYGRLFGSAADEAGWLLPAALALLVAGWVVTRGRPRRDPLRAGLVLWGGWLLVVGVVLSSLRGISHSYYTIELAPAVAAAVALGGSAVWTVRSRVDWARPFLAVVLGVSALYACLVLALQPAWPVVAIPVVAVAGVVAIVALVLEPSARADRPMRVLAVTAALVALLVGPATWSMATARSVHQGANVQAGPGVTDLVTPPGLVPGSRVPAAVADLVGRGAAGYDWAAVMTGRYAAQVQLTSGAPVRMLGGFTGGDPDPSLVAFQELVAADRIHYLVVEAGNLHAAPDSTAGQITSWVLGAFPEQQFQGWLVFDLTRPGGQAPV